MPHSSRASDRSALRSILAFGVALLAVAAWAGPALAVHHDALELDGNTVPDTLDDWDDVYLGTSNALFTLFAPDSVEPDFSTFATGSKDSDPASTDLTGVGGSGTTANRKNWVCNVDNNPQEKTNIFNAYAALYRVGGDLRLYMGGDREDAQGTSFIGFWLFQDTLSCTVPPGSSSGDHFDFVGTKRHGDLLFLGDFASGGTVPIGYKVYMWTDPTPGSPESGDECLGNGSVCGEAFPLLTGGDCQDNPHLNPHFCGTTNKELPPLPPPASNIDMIDAAWRSGIAPTQFTELGINLSQVPGVAGRCYRTFMAEGRSSVELTADLKDFVVRSITTCGQVTIAKVAVGGNATFPFDVTQGTLSPDPFSLSGGQSQAFTAVAPGTYAIQDILAQLPAGWALTDIQCAATGTGTSVVKDQPTGTVTITMELGGNVQCTFTNTLETAPAGPDVKITKSGSPDPVYAGGTLTYTLLVENIGNAVALDVTVTDTLPDGTAFVSCSVPGGASCNHNLGTVTADLGATPAGDSRTITIEVTAPSPGPQCPGMLTNVAAVSATGDTNSANNQASVDTECIAGTATITVNKVTSPAGDPTVFDFAITRADLAPVASFDLTDQDAPHSTVVTAPGSYVVTETPDPLWATTAVCAGGPFGTGAVYTGGPFTVAADEHVTCTFTNLLLRPCPVGQCTFCSKGTVSDVLRPGGARFKNNTGLDHVVRVDLGESIQAALDTVNDENGDGYVLIGIAAGPGSVHGGETSQHFAINRAYPRPFGLVGCSVTVRDDDTGNGQPTARITAAASNPPLSLPANGTAPRPSIFVMDVHAAGSEGAGWLVEGPGRELRNTFASGNLTGLVIAGTGSIVQGSVVERNRGVGIEVTGTGNTVESVRVHDNGSHGIAVSGPANLVYKAAVGDKAKGNRGDGVRVSGTGSVIREATTYANTGDGLSARGSAHQLIKNIAGDTGKGNTGDGIHVDGTGILLQENRARANKGDGFDVQGGTAAAPNRLRANESNTGPAGGSLENAGAEYRLLGRITNAGGGNKADAIGVPKISSPAKCAGFPANNATVTLNPAFVCE